jgi:hypothetical protein
MMEVLDRARALVLRGLAAMGASDQWDTTLRLTAAYAVIRFGIPRDRVGFWIGGLGIIALVFPRMLRSTVLWTGICIALAMTQLSQAIVLSENFLALCWFTAIALSTYRDRVSLSGAHLSARLLIGAVFAQAFAWKAILRPEFVNGSFTRFSLLFCNVFDRVTLRLGLMSPAEYRANGAIYTSIELGEGALNAPVPVNEPTLLLVVATVITVWTLATEGGIALTFLAPTRSALHRGRNVGLLAFLWTVYLILPVQGFGLLFSAMGYAQTDPDEVRARGAFAMSFLAILFWFYVLDGAKAFEIARLALAGRSA